MICKIIYGDDHLRNNRDDHHNNCTDDRLHHYGDDRHNNCIDDHL